MTLGRARTKARSVKMPPEVKAAYGEIQGGVKDLGKAINEIQQGVRRAERKIEADARARVRALRQEAKVQLGTLRAKERVAAVEDREVRFCRAAVVAWRAARTSGCRVFYYRYESVRRRIP